MEYLACAESLRRAGLSAAAETCFVKLSVRLTLSSSTEKRTYGSDFVIYIYISNFAVEVDCADGCVVIQRKLFSRSVKPVLESWHRRTCS